MSRVGMPGRRPGPRPSVSQAGRARAVITTHAKHQAEPGQASGAARRRWRRGEPDKSILHIRRLLVNRLYRKPGDPQLADRRRLAGPLSS